MVGLLLLTIKPLIRGGKEERPMMAGAIFLPLMNMLGHFLHNKAKQLPLAKSSPSLGKGC